MASANSDAAKKAPRALLAKASNKRVVDYSGIEVKTETFQGVYCWRDIGVYGNQSCARLKEFIHCRNCPVFAGAARASLERAIPEAQDEPASWTAKKQDRRAEARRSVLVFKLGKEWLGLEAQTLVEVSENRSARRIAHRAGGLIEGLVSIRGEMQLCLSLLGVLSIDARAPLSGERPRLVLVRDEASLWVFRVSHVRGVIGFSPAQLSAPAASIGSSITQHVEGILRVDDLTVSVLNRVALFEAFKRAVFE
jgi:chemotaxis-related protein WspD